MKMILSIAVSILALFAYAQEPPTFNVTLTGRHGDGSQLPKAIDSVFLNQSFKKTEKVYTNVSSKDTSFIITGVPLGKHWLLFSTPSFCISPFPIVVCSKCDNQFSLSAGPKKPGNDCNLFEMVEISPVYSDGDEALSKDFLRTLNKREKKKLKASDDFTVHFFLTKEGNISDPWFLPVSLPQEIKSIVEKGLTTVDHWTPAVRNGSPVDAEFSLPKQSMLNK
jgi:hypothetical protein